MAKEKIDSLIEGGKASAAPPLGPALGPLKINIGEVVAAINKKTEMFKGMKVPVKVIVDTETKEFEIEVGTPPVSQLIKKELGLQKGSGIPNIDKVANMAMEDVIKIAKMKEDSLFTRELRSAVKTVVGSANAMGVLVEGMIAVKINPKIDAGEFDEVIKAGKTEVSDEKRAQLKEQLDVIRKGFQGELDEIAATKKAADDKAAQVAAKADKATDGTTPDATAETAKPETTK